MEALTRAMSKQDRQPHMIMQGKAFGVPALTRNGVVVLGRAKGGITFFIGWVHRRYVIDALPGCAGKGEWFVIAGENCSRVSAEHFRSATEEEDELFDRIYLI
jgi:hypothetical protein